MTAVEERPVLAGTRAASKVKLTDQALVAVIFGGRQHDLSLPADQPVAAVVEPLLSLLGGQRREPGADGFLHPGVVTLARVDGRPLDRGQSLAEQSVINGDVLTLSVEDAQVALTPVTENASSAIAKFLASTHLEVTETVAARFATIASGVGAVVAIVLALGAWRINLAAGRGWDLWPAGALAALTLTLLTAGFISWWRSPDLLAANVLWFAGLLAAPAAAVTAVPGRPGAWHAVLGLVSVAVLGTAVWKLTPAPRGVLSWIVVTASGLGALALTRAVFAPDMFYLWVAAIAVALLVLKKSETLAGRLAGVPVPPFPTVTGKFVFDDADDIAAEALAAAEHSGAPSVTELTRSAQAANAYLTGLVAATAVFFVAGAWGAVIMPGAGRWWLSAGYVLMVAAILVLGGRAFADRTQACIIVAAALTMPVVVAVKYALWWRSPAAYLAAGAAVLTLGVVGVVLAAVVPRHVFSPPFRKAVEWLEYALIVLVPPCALWLCNLYYLIRNR